MPTRATVFGQVAANYERFRSGYPDAVVAAVRAYAGRDVTTALEIGAGTGKATRIFATSGIEVTAIEPDASMLAQLQSNVPDSVVTHHSTFEDARIGSTYDVVYAAAALH